MSFIFKFNSNTTHVFLHIPKNGGSALVEALKAYNPYKEKPYRPSKAFIGHLTYLETRPLLCRFSNPRYFCIVRNPWDRAVSYFFYIKQVSPKKHGVKDLHKMLNKGMSFSQYTEYLKCVLQTKFRPQSDYMIDENGNLAVDQIFQLERLDKDIKDFSQKLGISALPAVLKKNASEHTHYFDYYRSEQEIQNIREFEAETIKRFHYSFNRKRIQYPEDGVSSHIFPPPEPFS